MKERYEGLLVERNFFRSPTTHLVVKGTIVGEFNKRKFEQAVEELRRVHPMLRCIIEVDDNSQISFVYKKGMEFPITYLEKMDDDQWIELVKKEDHIPFKATVEPSIRFLILLGDSNFDVIMIGHHLLGDGLSFAYLFQDFIDIYCNEKKLEVVESKLITSYKDLPEESRFPKEFEETIHSLNEEWSKERRLFTEEEYEEVYAKYHERHFIDVLVLKVENEDYHALRGVCKEKNVTVNTFVFTAFLKALRELTEHETETVTIAMNIRDKMLFNPGRCIGNYASAVSPKLSYNIELDFWENAKEYGKIVKEKVNDLKQSLMVPQLFCQLDCSVIDALSFAAYTTYETPFLEKVGALLAPISGGEGIDISNLGALNVDLSDSDYELKDFVYMPPSTSSYDKTLGVVTMNDELTISIIYKEYFLPKDKMTAIKNRVKEILHDVIQIPCTV